MAGVGDENYVNTGRKGGVDGESLLSQMNSLGSEILASISPEMLFKILALWHPPGGKKKGCLVTAVGTGKGSSAVGIDCIRHQLQDTYFI